MIPQKLSLSAPRPSKALVALVLGIGLAVLSASQPAQASLVYSVTETNASGTPIGLTKTTASGLFTDFSYNVSVTESAGELDVAVSVNKLTSSTNKLQVTVTDTGFVSGGNNLVSVFSPVVSSSALAAIEKFSSTANGSTTTPTGSYSIPAGLTTSFGAPGVVNTPFSSGSPFSLSDKVLIALTSSGNFIQVNTQTFVAPEPGTLAMAGMGGIGLVGFGLRRRKAVNV